MKKFELTSEFVTFLGKTLFRIKALVSFGDVAEGELGGFIERENNLDQSGNAWVYGNAQVFGNAWVFGNAQVFGDAQVFGNAWVYGDAQVYGNAWVQNCRDYSATSCFGSENRTTTFFRTKDGGISVRCGCFYGTLREFREKVKERHGDSRLAKEYLMLADLMEFRLSKDE
nr:MAG TPA: Putative transferase, nesg, ydcK, Structural Genomics.38A [Caudoviricetes sp.]